MEWLGWLCWLGEQRVLKVQDVFVFLLYKICKDRCYDDLEMTS